MFDGRNIIYSYDGSFEGLMTAVFTAAYDRAKDFDIVRADVCQMSICDANIPVETDPKKASRVIDAAQEKIGAGALRCAYYAYLGEEAGCERAIYDFLMFGFFAKKSVFSYLAEPCVDKVIKMARRVSNEAEKLRGLVRFSVMEGGVGYAVFEPSSNVLPIITPHFVRRTRALPFVIHDAERNIAAIYDTHEWMIVSAEDLTLPRFSEDEEKFRAMWRTFYRAIGIKARSNPNLRRSLMPKKYWKYLTEMQ